QTAPACSPGKRSATREETAPMHQPRAFPGLRRNALPGLPTKKGNLRCLFAFTFLLAYAKRQGSTDLTKNFALQKGVKTRNPREFTSVSDRGEGRRQRICGVKGAG
ncbi:TPA: hypothetical protein ACX3LH_006418, partial [Klebsiella michiganensis]